MADIPRLNGAIRALEQGKPVTFSAAEIGAAQSINAAPYDGVVFEVPCGHPHVDTRNVDAILEKGFRWLMPAPTQWFAALERGLKASGRA